MRLSVGVYCLYTSTAVRPLYCGTPESRCLNSLLFNFGTKLGTSTNLAIRPVSTTPVFKKHLKSEIDMYDSRSVWPLGIALWGSLVLPYRLVVQQEAFTSTEAAYL
jgi:hypothetical protein